MKWIDASVWAFGAGGIPRSAVFAAAAETTLPENRFWTSRLYLEC
jgi:hypothetical protein